MSGFTFPGMDARTKEIAMADELRAEVMRLLHEERDQDRALLEKLVTHLTLPPRSTWRVVDLGGDDTPHDVGIEFPAQVVYVDNGSTANVQVRAPGDIAQSPPIAASGQGAWLIPGATQLTVTGTGIGQVRLRFLNEAAARLLYTGGPGGSTASPVYAELTGSLVSDASPGYVRLQDGANDNLTTVYSEYSVGNNDGNSLGNSYSLSTAPMAFVYNGTSWDRRRGIPGTDGVAASPYSGMQSVSITTATTTAVKASAGVVGTLSNASGATTGTITIYDNTSATGKTLWTGTLAAGQVLPLGIPCGTGITIVTAAADAIAVSYA